MRERIMIKKFRKKPVETEAIQWTGENQLQVSIFMAESKEIGWRPSKPYGPYDVIVIHTLEGNIEAQVGDWIIKGVKGEFYPCKPDIFALTYEEVTE
jgi:hypothetical protein